MKGLIRIICFIYYNFSPAGAIPLTLACSKRSDSGERCQVKKAMKSRGGLGREVRELAFIFSRSFLLRTATLTLT